MRAAFLVILLAACATAGAQRGLPSRADVQSALHWWEQGCWELAREDPNLDCVPVAPRDVRAVRCRGDASAGHPTRVLCRFSGVWLPNRRPYGPECAWLDRSAEGRWGILAFPDHDLCAF